MQITKETLSSLISGKVRMLETDDGYVTFRRFTEAQTERCAKIGRTKQPTTSAGMFLELQGDVKRIAFDYRAVIGTTRNFFGLSVLENGVHTGGFVRHEQIADGHFEYEPASAGKLTVYLPNLSAFFFKNVEIDGTFEPVKRPRKLFIAGDSITQGYDAEEPHRAYSSRLAEAMNAEMLNQAIGGDTFHADNLEDLPDFTPDAVVINYGTNDWARELDVKTNSDRYLKLLSETFLHARTFIIEPIWRRAEEDVGEKNGITVEDVRRYIREAAARYGLTVIPGIDLVPHDPSLFSDERLHPNDAGFDHYADNLIRWMKEIAPELFGG